MLRNPTVSGVILAEHRALCDTATAFEACLPDVEKTGQLILERLRSSHTVFACGNGGSATDAMHFCQELIGRYKGDRRPLPAVCLNADNSALTCIGNDYGFEAIFSRQIEALGRTGDVLVAFSTSGNSTNVRLAVEAASKRGVTTILLTGKDGGSIRTLADHAIIVPSFSTARIQELHTFILHAWLEMIERAAWG